MTLPADKALLAGIVDPSPAARRRRGLLRTDTRISGLLGALGAITALGGVWAPAALAGTATLQPQATSDVKLTYRAGVGERNNLHLYREGSAEAPIAYVLRDEARISPGVGCESTEDLKRVRCPVAADVRSTAALIIVGDRNDKVTASEIPEARPTIRGGPGNDAIDAITGLLDGGSGHDSLSGAASYKIKGTGARFVGGRGWDRIVDTEGRDNIDGGPGEDDITAHTGPDLIQIRDRASDEVNCGGRRQLVVADSRDFVWSFCRIRRNGPAKAALLAVYTSEDSFHSLEISVGCSADGPRFCEGVLIISTRRGRRLGSRQCRIERGQPDGVRFDVDERLEGRLVRGGIRATLRSRYRNGRAYALTKHMRVPPVTDSEEPEGD